MAMTIVDCLPVGFNFMPTDQILLEHYLFNKCHGLAYFQATVFDCDLYGSNEPWQIWKEFRGVDGKDLYLFTKLKRSTNHSGQLSAHANRKIGLAGGTWSGENSATPIFATENDDQIIGYCKRFRYENKEFSEHDGEWIMHEYSLHENLINNCLNLDYVLCRIRKNVRSKTRAKKSSVTKIQLMQKRVMAAKVNEMGNNERLTKSAKKTIDQRDVAPLAIYNMPCEPKMTTEQFISDVPYFSEMITENDMPYKPEVNTYQGTNNEAKLCALETTADQYTNNENVGDDFALWLSQILNTNQDTIDVSFGHEMATNMNTSDMLNRPEMTTNQSTDIVPY